MSDVLLTDMSLCRPSSAISSRYAPAQWLAYSYSTDTFSGRAIFAGPNQIVPEVCLSLNVTGWHHIYLGIHYGLVGQLVHEQMALGGGWLPLQVLRPRLTGDNWQDLIEPEYPCGRQQNYYEPPQPTEFRRIAWNNLDEIYWRTADLSDQALHFSPWREHGHEHTGAGIAFVRLVPMDDAALAEHNRELGQSDTRRVMVTNDGYFYAHHPTNEAEVRQWLEPMRDSDISVVAWGASLLDQCFYPTKVGRQIPGEPFVYPSALSGPRSADFDPLETAARVVHEMDIELYASMRPALGRMPPSHLPLVEGTAFHDRKDLWCRNRAGTRVGQVSLAYREVVDGQLRIMRDYVQGRSCDGVHYHFNRCFPFVLYEPPVVEAFKQAHGADPHELDPYDPRWLEHKAGYVTRFLRKVRAMLDEVGQQQGRRLKIAVTVMNSIENNFDNGIDVTTLLKEGLVDHLMCHPCTAPQFRAEPKVMPQTVAPIQHLADSTDCRVYADLYPRHMTADCYRQQALDFYRAGIYGVAIWDYYWRCQRKSEWAMVRRLGHRDDLEGWRDKAESFGRTLSLVQVAEFSMDESDRISSG